MTMPFPVYDYAGPTLLAKTAGWTGFAVILAVAVFLVAMSVRSAKRGVRLLRFSWLHVTVLAVLAYALAWFCAGPKLDHAWWYLQENVKRSHKTYRALTWATAFMPPRGATGRDAFIHIATRDSGFGKGRPYKAERSGARIKEYFRDEDYGEIVTIDRRPVSTGTRFAAMRKTISLVPLFEVPTAKKALLAGPESEFYAAPLKAAGLDVETTAAVGKGKGKFDFALVCLEPEWVVGAEFPSAEQWKALMSLVDSEYGAVAVHVDARLLPAARAKGLLEELNALFPSGRLWCTGRFDWVFVGFATPEPPVVRVPALLSLFERENAFGAFLDAGVMSVGDFFANYVGSLGEVVPALEKVRAIGRGESLRFSSELAFEPAPVGDKAQLKPGDLLPLESASVKWLVRGNCEEDVYTSLTGRVADVQWARRMAIAGLASADSGKPDDAVEKWAEAAHVNPHDPIIKSIVDSLEIEGRRRLKVGDNNGAMRCFENRILIEPENVAAIHNFGLSVKKGGRADLAAQVFLKAVMMDPLNDEHRLELVECASAAGKNDVAINQLDVLIKRHPEDVSLKQRRAKILVHGFVKEADKRLKEKEETK